MTSRRAAVLVAAAAATLATAPAAPAATLNLTVSLSPGKGPVSVPKGAVPKIEVDVEAPVGRASVDVSSSGATASVATRSAATEPPTQSRRRSRTGAQRRPYASPKARKLSRVHANAAPTTVERVVDRPDAIAGLRIHGRPSLSASSPLPEPPTISAGGTRLAAEALSSVGTTAALAPLFLLAIAFASWVAPLLARTLATPLLAFALQRPG